MTNRKRRRSLSDTADLADSKQQRMDKYISNNQLADVVLTNRFAALGTDTSVMPGDEVESGALPGEETPSKNTARSPGCQQLATTLLKLLSKGAILTSHSMAMLLDKIKALDEKVNDIREIVNNLPLVLDKNEPGDRRRQEEEGGKHLNNPAVSDLPYKGGSVRDGTISSLLTLQRNSLAISFNGQHGFHGWRNVKEITSSLN